MNLHKPTYNYGAPPCRGTTVFFSTRGHRPFSRRRWQTVLMRLRSHRYKANLLIHSPARGYWLGNFIGLRFYQKIQDPNPIENHFKLIFQYVYGQFHEQNSCFELLKCLSFPQDFPSKSSEESPVKSRNLSKHAMKTSGFRIVMFFFSSPF